MPEITVYCAVTDVQRWVKRVQFSTDTKVTPSDVDSYIQTTSLIVDGELRKLGITLPIGNTAKISLGILKTLVSFEAASYAENAAFFGGNKSESDHGKYLHDQYIALLEKIKENSSMLSDVVSATVKHMKSDTEDMNIGEENEGDEIFTEKGIKDFKEEHKILSPSELTGVDESITGTIDRTRV